MYRTISNSGSEAEVLLVEDHPGDVRLLQEFFLEAQIANPIHVATDGREALNFVHQRDEFADKPRPDIILLDWYLPRIDGEEVLRRLNEDPDLAQTFTVILTGSTMDEDFMVPSDLSVDGYLTKPVDGEEFLSLITSSDKFSLDVTGS